MDVSFFIETFFASLKGVPVSLSIMLVAIVFSFLPAMGLAVLSLNKIPIIDTLIKVYLAMMRATPLIVLILFFYSLFPSLLNMIFKSLQLPINIFEMNPIIYAYIIFTMVTIASLSELFRAVLMAVDKGQYEAGLTAGLTPWKSFWRIVFPQAMRIGIPSFTNLMLALVKGSSLVFVMTVQDIVAIAKTQAAYENTYIEAYLAIFLIYLILCGIIQVLSKYLENKYPPLTA